MNAATKPMNGTNGAQGRLQREITEIDIELAVAESEKMREQIRLQATEIGPILEALLRNAHGQIRWGLNE
ncbi:MAG TPA: hypothetical protein VMA13_01960 [Candidatus Saccharimonadales bacterium]|nr:hypothetical protein [Candidatus Saccharimonadales bacterium]